MTEKVLMKDLKDSDIGAFTEFTNTLSDKHINYGIATVTPAPNFKPQDFTRLKKAMRFGLWKVTDPVRDRLWTNLISARFVGLNIYEESVKQLYTYGVPDCIPVPPLCDKDHLPSYHLTPNGINTAKLVCTVVHNLHPDITSSPLMYPMVSLLLHYVQPDLCFQCIEGMLKCKERQFLSQTKVANYCNSRIMDELSLQYVFLLCSGRDRVRSKPDTFDDWMWWIFRDLPFPYLVCIMDSFLIEGEKVLFRVALTILRKYPKYYTKHDPSIPLLNQIPLFCKDIPIPIAKFMKSSFRLKRFSRQKLTKLWSKHESIALTSITPQASVHTTVTGPCYVTDPNIVTPSQMQTILSWCPERLSLSYPQLVFSSDIHGVSLLTLFNRVSERGPSIFIIKTDKDEVFGAFCSCDWNERTLYSYFGTGESFVFTLQPHAFRYPWVGLEVQSVPKSCEMFLSGSASHLIIGGGGHGHAIKLDPVLEHCTSAPCTTFGNPSLCSVNAVDEFNCQILQVFVWNE